MLDAKLVEMAAGLAFVFVLFSVLVSAANEMIVALFKSRAASLWDGIGAMLGDVALRDRFFAHPLVASVKPPTSWEGKFMTLARLVRLTSPRRDGPSYIEPRTFATVVVHLLQQPHAVLGAIESELTRTLAELRAGDTSGLNRASTALGGFAAALPSTEVGTAVKGDVQRLLSAMADSRRSSAELARALSGVLQVMPFHWRTALETSAASVSKGLGDSIRAVATGAAGGIEGFREGLERWFNEAMDRVSGWYKRWTQAVQFGLGLALAIVLNVDSIQIVRALDANDNLRRTVAAQADVMARQDSLDPRNITARQSSGAFGMALESTNSQEFGLELQLTEPPTGSGAFAFALEPADPSITLGCDEPAITGLVASVTCRVRGVNRRTEATLVSLYEAAAGRPPVTARMPLVLVPDAEAQYEAMQTRLGATALPLGWEGDSIRYVGDHPWWAICGWLLTALAASLGAPFWFDLLRKASNLRATGPNPNERRPRRGQRPEADA